VAAWWGVLLSAAVIAALISTATNAFLARRTTRLEERDRVRQTLAEAYQAYADYKEMPYTIRRRRKDDPAGERARLNDEISKIQSRLSYYQAWTRAESPETGHAYNELVTELRRVAGTSMRSAWLEPALDSDKDVNINSQRVDLSSLSEHEQRFLKVAEKHVAATTKGWWSRS
jgi:hypothetical protein